MSERNAKLVPLVLVVAAAAYCVSSYLQPPAPTAAERLELTQLGARLLDPAIEPAPARNQFELAGAAVPPPEPVKPSGARGPARPTSTGAGAAPGAAARAAGAAAKRPPEPPVLLEGWRLGATLIGRRRSAVVNGRVYDEGQTIPPAKPEGKALKLARVERDHVVLQDPRQPRFVTLAYGAASAAPGPGKPTPAGAKAGEGGGGGPDLKAMLSIAQGLGLLGGGSGARGLQGLLQTMTTKGAD
jgi:hypothetical protein